MAQFTIATVLAMRAHLDETHPAGFAKSISNVPIPGILGIKNPRTWDIEDPNTEIGYLNSHEVTSVIQHKGFRLWGNRTCSAEPEFAFEVATRTAQFLLDTIIAGCFPFIDAPMTPTTVRDIIDSINAKLRQLVTGGYLIGAECWYNNDLNNAQDLSQGKLYIDYDYTPVPVLENLSLSQRITSTYLIDFAQLVQQAG